MSPLRRKLLMNLSALPLVRGVYGLVIFGMRLSAEQAAQQSWSGGGRRYRNTHLAAILLTIEPENGQQRYAKRDSLLLIQQQLDVGKSNGVIDAYMSILVNGNTGEAQAAIQCYAVTIHKGRASCLVST